jgi:hypothetical protein
MTDETVHEIEQSPSDQEATDEELSAAFRELKARREALNSGPSVVEPEPEPEAEPSDEIPVDDADQVEAEPIEDVGVEVEPQPDVQDNAPDEPQDQAARSKLGRNVAELRRQNEVLQAKLYMLEQKLDGLPPNQMENPQANFAAPAATVQPAQDHDPFDPWARTPAQPVIDENYIGKIIEQREAKQAAARDQYMNSFANRIVIESKSDEPGLVSEIEKFVTDNYDAFDGQKTGDPVIDARIVYNHAKASVLSARLTTQANTPKPTLKQERPKPGTLGGGHSSVNDGAGRKATPKLDPKAQAAAEKMGLTPKEIEEYLNRPDPLRQAARR